MPISCDRVWTCMGDPDELCIPFVILPSAARLIVSESPRSKCCVCKSAVQCMPRRLLVRTVFALDVPQELRYSPLQDDHLDRWYSLGLQPAIDPFQQSMLLVRGYKYPSCPFLMSVGEHLRFIFRYVLFGQLHARYETTPCSLHKTCPIALCCAPQRPEPRSLSRLS